MKWIQTIAYTLVLAGSLHLGIQGLFAFNILAALVGSGGFVERSLAVLVGFAAVLLVVLKARGCWCACAACDGGSCTSTT